jgi:hypothetical protein
MIRLALATVVSGTAAEAATIDKIVRGDGQMLITVTGELEAGDDKRFADVAIGTDAALVVLAGPGGHLFAGLEIGKAIRIKGFATIVDDGEECASACALAWLGGIPRYMGPASDVGFHAAHYDDHGRLTSSPSANAAVGAYLGLLGLPLPAIVHLTGEVPQKIRRLSFADAEELGIEVRRIPPVPAARAPEATAVFGPEAPAGPGSAPLPERNPRERRKEF